MRNINNVELTYVNSDHIEALKSFELPNEQVQFTSLPSKLLTVIGGQYRIVILSENEPVGFFLLHSTDRVKEYSENRKAMLLTALSVNHARQGKGYAKAGMNLLSEFVKEEFPECDEIVLAVNYKNLSAQQLYKNVGFHDTGSRKDGRIGEQMIMCLLL